MTSPWPRKLAVALALWVSTPSLATELLVFAASSTQDVLSQLGNDFQAKTGTVVRFSFAGSNTLARQVVAGAPADIFVAADERSMDVVAQAQKVAPKSRRDLLSDRLVVVMPRGNSVPMGDPKELLQLHRLALGDPKAAPVGVYAKAWLTAEGLWPALEPKVIPALDARAALMTVAAGAADAAIVYQSDLLASRDVQLVYRVPLEKTPAIRYPVAKLTHAQGTAADDFLHFLQTGQARVVFNRYGFFVVSAP